MIIASAIKLVDGTVYVGKRHGDCFQNYKLINKLEESDGCTFDAIQGFINDKLEFLTRTQAYYESYSCGQCKKKEYDKDFYDKAKGTCWYITEEEYYPILFSEDLW